MKRNGMCPICYLKQIFMKKQKISKFDVEEDYGADLCPTPPMGWSSWNTFKNNIDEDLIYETATIMKDLGLYDAGYKYLNIDDCWHSNMRDKNGELQGDLIKFKSGMKALVDRVNSLGIKVGLYTSNGLLTCEDLPGSLGKEDIDAKTLAKWGVEYFKYDFCHNVPVPTYAPLVYAITIYKDGFLKEYPCDEAEVVGLAKKMPSRKSPCHYLISGLDAGLGKAIFPNIYVEEDGEYVVTVNIVKKGEYEKFLQVKVNGKDNYYIEFPSQRFWNKTARFQTVVKLNKGINKIELTNPISNRADSAFYLYHKMGQELKKATEGKKPIVYSICEWGNNYPQQWGAKAGNLWRTTPDIRPFWIWVMYIYRRNVKLYKFSKKGAYNDPDMLEVGNRKLTENQNKSHFSVWCMMAAPLILGNDLRKCTKEILDIVTNKDMIAIDQDPLCKAAKRIKKGGVDILAKPLSDGKVAVCFFNKGRLPKSSKIKLSTLQKDKYVSLIEKNEYNIFDVWDKTNSKVNKEIKVKLGSYESKVYIIEA